MSEIIGKKVALFQLFNNEFFFRIPEYQRPYSWETENCEQLFDDIFESSRDNEYFLGTLVLQNVKGVGTGTKYDIIDGQQRITTLQILIACLRDAVDSEAYKKPIQEQIYQPENPVSGVPELVRLEVKEKIFFKNHVQEKGSTHINDIDVSNDQQENLSNAIKLFHRKLTDLAQTEIEALISHISQKCIVIYVSTKNFDDAYRLFTIINDRGMQLRRIDILKANNIDPSVIANRQTRVEYSKIWEDMEDELGSDDFEKLFYILRTIEIKEKAKEDILKEFENLIFKKGKIKKGKKFIEYVKKYQEIFKDLILDMTILEGSADIKNQFNNLLSVMNGYLKGNDWIPPILYYYKKYNKEKIFDFLLKLEMKYSSAWLLGQTKDKRLIDMCSILKVIASSKKVTDVLNSNEIEYDKKEVKNVLKQTNFYKRGYAKYILVKLEYLSCENNVQRTFGATSIEHVLPQNPKPSSDWAISFDDDDRDEWTNNIANLVLLSKRKNASASNYEFKKKKEKYFKGKITDLPRSLEVLKYKEWTPEILKERKKDILKKLVY